MSVLSTTNTGLLKKIKDYFDTFITKGSLESYRYSPTKDKSGKYHIVLQSKYHGSVITLDAKEIPCCYVEFENKPYPTFIHFNTPEDFEKIDKHFYINTYRYIFRYCCFTEDMMKLMIHSIHNIEDSFIFVPKNFYTVLENKYNIYTSKFLKWIRENRNVLYVNKNEPGQEPNYIACQRKDIEKYLDIVTQTI